MAGYPRTHCYSGHEYGTDNFYTDKHTGWKTCRICKIESARKWRDKPGNRKLRCEQEKMRRSRPEVRKRVLELSRQKLYGISPEQYQHMLKEQDYKCSICLTELLQQVRSPAVDHDHSCCSGAKSCGRCVRGIICFNCNGGLGNFKDDISSLMAAVEYMRLHEDRLARAIAEG